MGSSPVKQGDNKDKTVTSDFSGVTRTLHKDDDMETLHTQMDGKSNPNFSAKFPNQPRYNDDIRDYEDKLAIYNLNKDQIESGEHPESGDGLESEYYGKFNTILDERYEAGLSLKGKYDDGRNNYYRHWEDTNTMEKLGKPPKLLNSKEIKVITPELNTTPPEPVVKKAKLPPELRPEKKKVKKKRAKVKRVKRPKRTSTRNLVTGGRNRTRRSTGTSKRR